MTHHAVEEVSDVEQHHTEHVHGPNCSHGHHDHDEQDNEELSLQLNRNEKKVRKELIRYGLVQVHGINRVTFKRGKMIFAISEPEVYRNPADNSYVVFGEATGQNPALQAQLDAATRMAQQAAATTSSSHSQYSGSSVAANIKAQAAKAKAEEEEELEGEEVDASDLSESDIKIVMEQANVSRNKAIRALKEHDNDVVNTIMELSM